MCLSKYFDKLNETNVNLIKKALKQIIILRERYFMGPIRLLIMMMQLIFTLVFATISITFHLTMLIIKLVFLIIAVISRKIYRMKQLSV